MPSDEKNEPAVDAESRRQELTLEIQGIQAQLGDKLRTDDNGVRLKPSDYWAWKKKAQHALNQKLGELREIKASLREQRKTAGGPSLYEAIGHLKNLSSLVEALVSYGEMSLESSEQKQIDAAKDFLSRATAT